ncbi:MAG: ABC transporter ATP-binding protein [Alphaproteobacteria bacterium]
MAQRPANIDTNIWRESVGLLRIMTLAYPAKNILAVVLVLLAGLLEGFSVVMFLPLLAVAMGEQAEIGGEIIDTVTSAFATVGLTPTIGSLLALIVVFITSKAILNVLAATQVGYTSARMMTDLRLELIRSLMRARWSYFVTQPTGILATALGHEAKVASSSYQKGIKLVTEAFLVLIYASVALLTSWQVTLAGLAFGAVTFVFLHGLIRIAHSASDRNAALMRSLVDRFTDSLSSIKPIKAMALENRLLPLLEHESDEINMSHRREVFGVAMFQGVTEPLVVLILAGGIFVALEFLALPFAQILFMAIVLQRMITRVNTLQGSYQALVVAQTTFWRLRNSIDDAHQSAEQLAGTEKPALDRALTFRGVQFGYDETNVLQNLDIDVPVGQCTAIIGPSGAGKTTILDLVTGLIRPDAGEIAIDDTPLTETDLRWWRGRIGYVPQDSVLFHDSILSNVTLGDPKLSETDAEAALRAAGLWEFVLSEPEGLDTLVGERGTRLSGGQRQRLAIARALVRKPALLILDEATASLDPQTEREVIASLAPLKGKVTIIAISHQPAILTMADVIYRIQHGAVTRADDAAERNAAAH